MFANLFALRNVCQPCQRMAEYAISINNLNQKYIKKGERLPVLRATQCWQTYLFRAFLFTHEFGNICAHECWPPRTSPDNFGANIFDLPRNR